MEFKEWFCLKDRDSFTIDPKVTAEDARFYFGRSDIKDKILRAVRLSFVEPGVPKIIIYGAFGSGKTQTLYYIKHYMENNQLRNCKYKPLLIHLDLEMQRKSNHISWHSQLLEALGKDKVQSWLQKMINAGGNIDSALSEVFQDSNIKECVKKLLLSGDIALSAWRWLCGQAMSNKELNELKVTRNLGQLKVEDLTDCLVGIGSLAKKNGEIIIFLMDEAEQFQDVKDVDSMKLLHDYERSLCEPSNKSIGFIIAGYAITEDDMPQWYIRQDVKRRIGNPIEIPPLEAVKEVEIFVKELIEEFVDKDKADKRIKSEKLKTSGNAFPFTKDSLEKICQYAIQDPTKALPSHIIKTITECAIRAWDEEKAIIEDDIVDAVAPLIFG